MDARLDPAKYAGLSEGDAHVIRNAGGRASDDAIRSLVISYKLLGTQEWFVIHHTECGMEFFDDEKMRELLGHSLETAELGADGFRTSAAARAPARRGISTGSRSPTVITASSTTSPRIRAHPLVPSRIPIYGYVYDVKTGRLVEVAEAHRDRAKLCKARPTRHTTRA